MGKLLNETLMLLKEVHFTLISLQLIHSFKVDADLSYRVQSQILKVKRFNNLMEAKMDENKMNDINLLFVTAKRLDRLRGSYLKLSEKHQESEKASLEMAVNKFDNAVKAFVDNLSNSVNEKRAEEILNDIIESRLAGIVHEKFKACVGNEIEKIYGAIENLVLERFTQEAFIEKVRKSIKDVPLEECVAGRPDEFIPKDLKTTESKKKEPVSVVDDLLDSIDIPTKPKNKKINKKSS